MGLENKISKLKYKNLYSQWLEAHAQPPPQGFNDITQFQQEPYSEFIEPEDFMKYLYAQSPQDL